MPRPAILPLLVLAAGFTALASGCASDDAHNTSYSMATSADKNLTASAGEPAPMDPSRSISVGDCSQPLDRSAGGNLSCR